MRNLQTHSADGNVLKMCSVSLNNNNHRIYLVIYCRGNVQSEYLIESHYNRNFLINYLSVPIT